MHKRLLTASFGASAAVAKRVNEEASGSAAASFMSATLKPWFSTNHL